ncbi:hypothetical protein C1A38_05345 [Verrucosispora sp. ts21]|nr:hypothetical protein C1A38_05345 [Verrucosispora sp. ts21]
MEIPSTRAAAVWFRWLTYTTWSIAAARSATPSSRPGSAGRAARRTISWSTSTLDRHGSSASGCHPCFAAVVWA